MFLSKLFKRTRARVVTALAGMAMIVGAAAAISSGVSAVQNETAETNAVASTNVTNGNKRINVIIPSSSDKNWIFDSSAKIFSSGVSDGVKNFDFAPDTDIGSTTRNATARNMGYQIDGEDKWIATKSLGTSFTTTWWDISVERHSGSDYWNKKTYSNGKVWIDNCNTYYYDGDSISAWGYYYKVALITGKNLENISYSIVYANDYLPADPAEISGYTFSGWYSESSFTNKCSAATLTGDKNFYAKYTPNKYSVSISAGTGVSSVYLSTNANATSGSSTGTKFNMDATVYGFAVVNPGYEAPASWTLVAGTADKYRVTSKTVTTSGASFGRIDATAKNYTVTVNLDGGEDASNKSYYTSASAQTVALDTPTKSGKNFAGYTVTVQPSGGDATITGHTTLNIPANAYGAITVTATWADGIFTIAYDANGGTGDAPEDQEVVVGSTDVVLADWDGVKTGYDLSGWNTEDDGEGTHYDLGEETDDFSSVAKDDIVTLYAEWTIHDYSITYMDKGGNPFSGSHEVGYPDSYNYGTGATLDTPSKSGYTFGGYYSTSACTGESVPSITSSETGDKTFYAKWVEYQDFWISFDGGTTKQALTKVSATTGSELYQLSTVSTLTVFGGESVTFWRGKTAGEAIAFTYASNGLTADTTGGTNNIITTDNTWTVRNYATDINVYIKIFADASAYKFYLGGKTGSISPTTNGVSSGSTFYVQDLLKKNGSSTNFGTDNAKIGVYFFNPVGELDSVASWASAFCAKISTVDNVDLYSVTVPEFAGHNMKWGSVIVVRFPSGTSVSDMDFNHTIKDGSGHHNGIKINAFSSDIQNGAQVTAWTGGTSGDANYPCAGNAFMYTDGGLASGMGVYIDISTAPAGSWKFTGGYGIYCYFFSVVNGSGEANAWSAQATLVPGETSIYECEVPQYSSANVEWAKLIVVNNNTAAFVEGKNQYQTQDLWYNSTMRHYQHITFTGNLTGEYKAEAASNSFYTDATRAESWGTRFNSEITCSGTGTNTATTEKWATAKSEYDAAPSAARNLIKNSAASSTGTQLQKAVSKYDDIIYKYGIGVGVVSKTYEDFISRNGTPNYSGGTGYAALHPGMVSKADSPLTMTLWIVLGAGLAGLAAIGTAYFVSKKKKRYQA